MYLVTIPVSIFAPVEFEKQSIKALLNMWFVRAVVVVFPFVPVIKIVSTFLDTCFKISGYIFKAIFPGKELPLFLNFKNKMIIFVTIIYNNFFILL